MKLFSKRVTLTEKLFFAQYLALMLRAGIPLTRGLEFLHQQMSGRRMKEVLKGLARDISGGLTIAESLKKYPDIFDDLFVNMIASGEISGNLDEVLDIIAEELRKSAELRSKVIGALIYPAIVITVMIIVSVFIVFFIFPRIIKVYETMNVQVPALTRLLIFIIKTLSRNMVYIGVGFLIFVLFIFILYRSKKGKRIFHWLWLHIPIVKILAQKINVVQFCRTLSSLIRSGISIPEALEITSSTFKNIYYREAVFSMANGIRQGKKISDLISSFGFWIFPPILSQMAGVGEETGNLSNMLRQLSSFYEREVDMMLDNFSKIIEPILMIVLGAVVGFIALATIQLIYASLQKI